MTSATFQHNDRLISVEIIRKPLSAQATDALRSFWQTMPAVARATLNSQINAAMKATRCPDTMRANVSLSFLWAAMDVLALESAWNEFAGRVRWAAMV